MTLRTAGVSDNPMTVPAGREDRRFCELLTYLPAGWDLDTDNGWWPATLLKLLGQFVHENDTWFSEGHTVLVAEPGDSYTDAALVSAALLRAPIVEPNEFNEFESGGERCSFLWVSPITEAETNLKLDQGADALLTLIQEHHPEHVLDPRRACLVTGRKP